jgi:hypothetical protein
MSICISAGLRTICLFTTRLSRNARAHWYFSHLNTRVRVQNRVDLAQFTGDIEVVSVMPEEPVPADWDWDTSSLYEYKVPVPPTVLSVWRSRRSGIILLMS